MSTNLNRTMAAAEYNTTTSEQPIKPTLAGRFTSLTRWPRAKVVLRTLSATFALAIFIMACVQRADGNDIYPLSWVCVSLAIPIDLIYIYSLLYPESKVGEAFTTKLWIDPLVTFLFAALMSQGMLWNWFSRCGFYGCIHGREYLGDDADGYPIYGRDLINLALEINVMIAILFAWHAFYFFFAIYDLIRVGNALKEKDHRNAV